MRAATLTFVLCSAVVVCYGSPITRGPVEKLAMANNQLGLDILKTLNAKDKNAILSPFSISSAMGMLYTGASGNTAQEMRKSLGYESTELNDNDIKESFRAISATVKDSPDDYTLEVSNQVLVHKRTPVLDDYKKTLTEKFDAVVREVDFAKEAKQLTSDVNNWVNEKTHGKIQKLLDQDLSPQTRLFLLNAVYFKGTWKTQFSSKKTVERSFFNHGDKEAKVQMMHLTSSIKNLHDRDLNMDVIELPYKGEDMNMLVFLPHEKKGLEDMKNKLSVEKLQSVVKNMRSSVVDVALPKFKAEASYSLNEAMKSLGMKDAFSTSADFSNINGLKDLVVSEVVHKAVIEVNEEGSEAAAVTGIGVRNMIPSLDLCRRFVADHPFMFMITHVKTGGVLFIGHVNEL